MSGFDLSGKRVLLTGAAGFIGSHLCRRLIDAGALVHATSREVRPAAEPTLRWHQLDLADAPATGEIMRRVEPQVVVHLASHVAGSRDLAMVLPTFHANLASTVYLLTAAQEVGVERIVLAGSLEEPEPGEALAVPASPYAAAKAAMSSYARMFYELYQAPVVLARIFMAYGPGTQDLKKLVPYVALSRLRGDDVKLSSGTRPVDWVYVEDVAEGLLRLATTPDVEGRRIDLGSGELVTIRAVVEKLFALTSPGTEPVFGGLADRSMEQVRKARAEETEELLGWRPPTALDAGLAATVEYFRKELAAGRLP